MIPDQAEAQSRKRLKELEKTEERQQEEASAAEEEGRQRHMDIQSKQTRKEMKRYRKQSKRYNKNRREPFYKRWFRRKKR
jgi:hypothetical protein